MYKLPEKEIENKSFNPNGFRQFFKTAITRQGLRVLFYIRYYIGKVPLSLEPKYSNRLKSAMCSHFFKFKFKLARGVI